MKIYHHVITLDVPTQPDGAEVPGIGLPFYSTHAMSEAFHGALSALSAKYGFAMQHESHELFVDEDEVHAGYIGHFVDAMREQLGLDRDDQPVEGAAVNYDDARLNEMERSVRNQGRKLDAITEQLAQISALMLAQLQPVQGVSVGRAVEPVKAGQMVALAPALPREMDRAPAPTEPEPQAPFVMTPIGELAAKANHPLVGTPVDPMLARRDPTLPINPNSRGNTATPEMLSGQMSTMGPSPRSEMISFQGRQDNNGNPVFEKHTLPVVGDSLESGTTKSDIVVPR